MIEIREPKKSEFNDMFSEIWGIMRKPFGLPKGSERNDNDSVSQFVIAYDKDKKKIIGAAKLTLYKDKTGELDDVGVEPEYRHHHVGEQLLKALHEKAKKKGVKKLFLRARKTAEGFYKTLGYSKKGDYFRMEPLNTKHVRMEIEL